MKITLDLALFRNRHSNDAVIISSGERVVLGLTRKDSERALLWFLDALVNVNRDLLRANRLPPLYRADVRYVREEDTENWQDCVKTYLAKEGDCEDLAAWRVAELRNQGKKASCRLTWRKKGKRLIYHVTVLRADGTIEDPSLKLGMRGPDGE